MFHNSVRTELIFDGNRAVLRFDVRAIGLSRHVLEFGAAWLVLMARRETAATITPREVVFAHAAPASWSEHARVF